MTTPPRFTICIPTRNRAPLLREALLTALEQDFDDYEVIVSNNGCTDDTDDVVEEFRDSRVRYLRTERSMAMPEHWEWMLGHVRGDYVRILCDDDALLPRTLASAESFLNEYPDTPALVQDAATYVHPDAPAGMISNSLEVKRPRESTSEPDPMALYRSMCSGDFTGDVPTLLNCFVSRKCFENIRARCGQLLPPPIPDFGFATTFILCGHRWIIDERVAWLSGRSTSSIGAMQALGENEVVTSFVEEFGDDSPLATAPVPSFFIPTWIAAAVGNVSARMGVDCNFDLAQHFVLQFESLARCEMLLGFTSQRRVLLDSLARVPSDRRAEIDKELRDAGFGRIIDGTDWWRRAKAWQRAQIRRLARASSLFGRLTASLHQPPICSDDVQVVEGDKGGGFHSMAGAAAGYADFEAQFFADSIDGASVAAPAAEELTTTH